MSPVTIDNLLNGDPIIDWRVYFIMNSQMFELLWEAKHGKFPTREDKEKFCGKLIKKEEISEGVA